MSVALYMDVHVPESISEELTRRGIDVLTAQQDGTTQLDDDPLLDRATSLNRALFTGMPIFSESGRNGRHKAATLQGSSSCVSLQWAWAGVSLIWN